MTFEPYERMTRIERKDGREYSGKKQSFACCMAREPSKTQV